MYPLSATRISTISAQNDSLPDPNHTGNAARRTEPFKGYDHLLENTTLEEVLGQPDLKDYQIHIIRRALVYGYFPHKQDENEDIQFFACWLAQHKQAKLLCLWSEKTPLSILVLTKETAAGLLAIMQSTLSFSGLTLELGAHRPKDRLKEVIPLLVQAFQANASLTKIKIISDDYDCEGLAPLYDVLAGVAGLEFFTEGRPMGSADLALVSTLLSRNKTLRVLKLNNLRSDTFNYGEDAPETGSVVGVIKHIAGQLQIERLELNDIPPKCGAVIGELMCTSHVLKELKIGLDGSKVDKALIDGFSRTSSVESVCLSVLAFKGDMLDLVTSIAETNVSIKSIELRSQNPHVDLKDNSGICSLISSHRTLASLTWELHAKSKVDLAKIGAALEKNIRLETLTLVYNKLMDGSRPGWIDETSISMLAENLKKNHTLTDFVLVPKDERHSPVKQNYSVLQQVLDRNSAFQRYACSAAFLYGAAEGFLAAINIPADLASVTAEALMHYKPRTGAAALALVNKATYAQALFRRRQAHAAMLDRLIPIERSLVINRRKEMIDLLNGIIVTNEDFSTAELSRIAESPSLPGALVAIMFRSPRDYLYLVQLFCQAVGLDKIRSLVIDIIAKDNMTDASASDGTGNDFLLSMLQQSFPHDQKHLSPFVEKELNYDAINSAAVKLFVGYNIPKVSRVGSNKAELLPWCMENSQPGVLIAYYDACRSKVRIDFTKYTGAFARSMMNKIPQLKKANILFIEGIPAYEDALVLYRALAETSILEELHIDEGNCGPEFDFIMQGLCINKSIKQLTLACRTISDAPAICATLASLLEANSTIAFIDIALYDDDPELPDLTQLAEIDERLNLMLLEHEEPSSESDEAQVQ